MKLPSMSRHLPALALSSLLIGATAFASQADASTVLISDNFESYNIDTTPTNPGDGNPNNWTTGGSLNATVVASSLTPDTKALHLTNVVGQSGALNRIFERIEGSAESADTLSLTFKVRFDTFTDSSYWFVLRDETLPTGANSPINIRINANGAVTALQSGGTAITIINASGSTALVTGTWYEFTIDADLQTQTFDVSVLNLTTSVSAGRENLTFRSNLRSFNNFIIQPASTASSALDWQIDDIVLTSSIPEPGSVAALLIGGAVAGTLLTRRNRR